MYRWDFVYNLIYKPFCKESMSEQSRIERSQQCLHWILKLLGLSRLRNANRHSRRLPLLTTVSHTNTYANTMVPEINSAFDSDIPISIASRPWHDLLASSFGYPKDNSDRQDVNSINRRGLQPRIINRSWSFVKGYGFKNFVGLLLFLRVTESLQSGSK